VNTVIEKINAILIDEFELSPEDLRPEASIRDTLELDSLDAVDLAVLLQDETGATVEANAFASLETLGELHRMVEDLLDPNKD
jgi:acyl carrier protein